MKLSKLISLLLITSALMLLLVACGVGSQPSDSPTTLPIATFTQVLPAATPTPTAVLIWTPEPGQRVPDDR